VALEVSRMRYEIDYVNRIIDLFVQRDEKCPVPFISKHHTDVMSTPEPTEAHEGTIPEQFRTLVSEIFNSMGEEFIHSI